ncbi:hypothetical protein PMI27_004033 [Pseudomonas sp. GM41(2012)]|uniref:hypothetical protein n=1 Tax=Pseudomonas sp. (strain GM41(2012)) TaxID=1144708 RepID=UPI00026FF88D|nr:hypothetical protein [Pseudomonas sp. GM41(2012)]EUB72111.1 hypothetical protein PMI27_004033 [Pseudomonas sp. GM41(2012)]
MEKPKTKKHSDAFYTADISHRHSAHQALLFDEIQQALTEADSGDFASPKEMKAVLSKWVTNIS